MNSVAVVLAVLVAAVSGISLRQSNTYVAFSAGLSADANFTAATNIKYDKVWTNSGKAYDPTTGIFTCPHAGTYVFLFHALTTTTGTMWVDLYKNTDYQITGYAHSDGAYAATSNSMVLQLAVGDTVYLKVHGTGDQVYGRSDEIYSTFNGFILLPRTS